MTIEDYQRVVAASGFRHGVYKHWREGDMFTTLAIIVHHETRLPMVVYVSHKYGWVNCRPLRGWRSSGHNTTAEQLAHDPDGFLDAVTWSDGRVAPRFELVREATPTLAAEAPPRIAAAAGNEADPRCYGCGGPRSAHGADGRSMAGWPNCRQFRAERPSWYPEGKGIEEP